MLDIFGYTALFLAILVGAVVVMAGRRPDTFRFSRTARIAATPGRLFPLIADLHQMNTWNPYALRETSGTGSYSGPASGQGAKYEFAGPNPEPAISKSWMPNQTQASSCACS